jgi:hypothetical protein
MNNRVRTITPSEHLEIIIEDLERNLAEASDLNTAKTLVDVQIYNIREVIAHLKTIGQ